MFSDVPRPSYPINATPNIIKKNVPIVANINSKILGSETTHILITPSIVVIITPEIDRLSKIR
jgi:hypothetical protein